MVYVKVEEGNVVKVDKVQNLVSGVSNPIGLDDDYLKTQGIYKAVNDSPQIEEWQRIKGKTYSYDADKDIVVTNYEVEDLSLEEYKEIKKAEIKNTLPQIIDEGFTSSSGIKIDIKTEDRSNWMNTLQLLNMTGVSETTVRDYNNETHIISKADYEILVQEAGAYVQKQFTNKWLLQETIDNASTYADVQAIYWREANYDENDEFVDYTYNEVL